MSSHNQALLSIVLLAAPCLPGAERRIDPYFLHRSLDQAEAKQADIGAGTARYKAMFGVGDADQRLAKSVGHYGELTVDSGGASGIVSYPDEEQIYYILDGTGVLHYGDERVPVKKDDFMYLPVGVKHGMSNTSTTPCRLLIMGFKIPAGAKVVPTPKLLIANAADVEIQPTHGPGTKFKLLLGETTSKRDKLAAGQVVTSLFLMEFDPGIDNFPHHHEMEEEIYLILRGRGEMATGAGPAGAEGRYPVKAGEAYFFRANATVGFYRGAGAENPLILAVRSLCPLQGPSPH